jgi:hypothetical protein
MFGFRAGTFISHMNAKAGLADATQEKRLETLNRRGTGIWNQ